MSIVNQANTNKFKTIFSNIPVPTGRTDVVDMGIFNNYVKNVTLPDYSVELVNSDFLGEVRKTPSTRVQAELSPLTIEFVADEDYDNWATCFEWLREMRCGNSSSPSQPLHSYNIKQIYIQMRDNQNRSGLKFVFNGVILINLSSLNLVFGSSEQVVFSCTYQYSSFDIIRGTTILNN